jgi:hypothetical protein
MHEFVRVMTHGVVDTPDFHDRNDGAGGCAIGDRQIRAHFAIAQFHLDVLRFHFCCHSFKSV